MSNRAAVENILASYAIMAGVTAVAIQFIGSWHGAFHVAWNAVAVALGLLYIVAVVIAPAAVLPGGRKQKVWWIVMSGVPTASFAGFWVPLGVLISWPFLLERYRPLGKKNPSETGGI